MAGAGRIAAPLELLEQAAPATPSSGGVAVYAKADRKVYSKDSTGAEVDLSATGAASASEPVVARMMFR